MSASTANRPVSGRINVHEPGDYPIILGESLKNESPSQSQYLRLRYNWEPRQGFSSQTGTLKRSGGQTQLAYKDDKTRSSTYDYRATVSKQIGNDEADQTTQFALIFDPKKSAYILEQITQSFDLNLTSAHDQSSNEVRQHRQINHSQLGDHKITAAGAGSPAEDDEEPDAANPFDFRHFLSEAKENAEKTIPAPGNRTPLSGVPSPSLMAGRVISTNTPQFRSTPTSAPLHKKAPVSKTTGTTTSKRPSVAKRKPIVTKPSASQPLSNEVVSDSSDEDTQNTIPASRPSTSQTKDRGHNRSTSTASMGRSPNIVVTSGDLEIDMGSPTHEPSRRAVLDLDAFRSQTQTPTLPLNANRTPVTFSHHDIEMRDRSDDEDEDEDEDDREVELDRSADIDDDDVDELALGSPMPEKEDARREEMEKAPTPPTPSAPPAVDDDEEDFLAAELAKELGQDDDTAAPSANMYDDDESEISEEE